MGPVSSTEIHSLSAPSSTKALAPCDGAAPEAKQSVGSAALAATLERFIAWLDRFGEESFDHQSYFAGPIGGRAKALYYRHKAVGTLAVAPMIFSEAFLPAGRRLFHRKQRFAIADAHYAMGFALLAREPGDRSHLQRAVHFLEVLEQTRSRGYRNHCWGYPFDWVTRNGVMPAGLPLVTTLPYVYEAFSYVYRIDGQERWQAVMRSAAEHAAHEIPDRVTSATGKSAGYHPGDAEAMVVNASAYRAYMLHAAARDFSNSTYRDIADANLAFVLDSQQSDGSWRYAMDGVRHFVDHFHTCFVLKALAKIERMEPGDRLRKSIDAGVSYYVRHLFDERGLPRPFSQAPRLTVYRHELYDYAECINLAVLLKGRSAELDERLRSTVADLLGRWCKPDGSFRSRELILGWDEVPMHRWAQSQMFRSLCLLLGDLRGQPLPA